MTFLFVFLFHNRFRSSLGCWALFYKAHESLSVCHADSCSAYRLRFIANIVEGSPTRSVFLQPIGKYLFLFQDLLLGLSPF